MMNDDNKRLFMALGLSLAIIVGWQYIFPAPVAPVVNKDTQKIVSSSVAVTQGQEANQNAAESLGASGAATASSSVVAITLNTSKHSVGFNENLDLLNFTSATAVYPFQELASVGRPFHLYLKTAQGLSPVLFALEKKSDATAIGTNEFYGLTASLTLEETGKVAISVQSSKPYHYGLQFVSVPKKADSQIRKFVYFTEDLNEIEVGKTEEPVAENFQWLGVDFNYHLLAASFPQKLKGVLAQNTNDQILSLSDAKTQFSYSLIFTRKNYDHLTSLGDNLKMGVNFGFFAIIAVPILRALQFLYDHFPNYGVAIIILTFFIRLIMFPLQVKSFRSMKIMQDLQPELKTIKEKFKDEPEVLQRETMALFKRNNASPLGGCLPILLQIPIFMAFYQVLFNAVELVHAPFALWLIDLSVKDPFYVLPVLMTVSFVAQQKLTPSTSMDPLQQKIMTFMPIVFGFLMKDLPAGLLLYMVVSTIFGILQQLFVYRFMSAPTVQKVVVMKKK